jgi:hypothetical protein
MNRVLGRHHGAQSHISIYESTYNPVAILAGFKQISLSQNEVAVLCCAASADELWDIGENIRKGVQH